MMIRVSIIFLENYGCVSMFRKLKSRLMFQKESRSSRKYEQKVLFRIFLAVSIHSPMT